MNSAAHHEIHFNLDFDAGTPHQQLGFAGIGRRKRVGLKASCLQAFSGPPDGLIDMSQRLIARQAVVGKYEIQIDRQPRHVADEQIDRGTAFEREGAIHKYERGNLGQQACGIKVGLVHGLSTSKPSAERDTQGRALPVGSCAGSSFATQGRASSRPSCRHRRTVLTLAQCCSNSRSTSTRRL